MSMNLRSVPALLVALAFAVPLGGCASKSTAAGEASAAASEAGASAGKDSAVEEAVTLSTAELQGGASAETSIADKEGMLPLEEFQPVNPLDAAYHLGPGDMLQFRMYDEPTLDSPITVRYDGFISLPFVEDLNVMNLTRIEAVEMVKEAYKERFVEPDLDLAISDVRSKSYYVMGSVTRPSEFPYIKPITLLDAINTAGGMRVNTRSGDSFVGSQGQLVKALIIRVTANGRRVKEFDLRSLESNGPHESGAAVFPGDVIYVPEGVNLVYILGQVARPAVYELQDGMTLIRLLTQAGGPIWRSGKMGKVILLRQTGDDTTEAQLVNVKSILGGAADPLLEPGDVVYIPRKRVTRMSDWAQQFNGSISPVLSLYNQVWDTFYTDNRYRRLYDNNQLNDTGLAGVQQLIQTVGSVQQIVTP